MRGATSRKEILNSEFGMRNDSIEKWVVAVRRLASFIDVVRLKDGGLTM
jgi:hypothetical protein